MKKIYFLALGAFLGTSALAQTIIDPSTVAVENITVINDDVPAYSDIFNQSAETKEYIWERNVIELTEGWETAVCDPNLCHLSFVEQATFILEGNSSGDMDVHVYPNEIPGAAIVEVTVVNVADEEDFAVATYYFNQALSVPERITNALKIYPNPAISEFFIEGADDVQRIEIFSVSGKLVKEVQSFGKGSLNVSDLGTGNYIVRMWDDSNARISTNVLTVQ